MGIPSLYILLWSTTWTFNDWANDCLIIVLLFCPLCWCTTLSSRGVASDTMLRTFSRFFWISAMINWIFRWLCLLFFDDSLRYAVYDSFPISYSSFFFLYLIYGAWYYFCYLNIWSDFFLIDTVEVLCTNHKCGRFIINRLLFFCFLLFCQDGYLLND